MSDFPFEVYECSAWLNSVIEGDTGTGGLMNPSAKMISGAFMDLIPEDIALPAVRYHVQAPKDVRGLGRGHATRIMSQIDWLIVVVREGHLVSPLVPIVQRLDTVLTGATGSTSLVTIDACERIEPFQMLEVDKSGVMIRHAGGIYRTVMWPK